MKEKKQLRAFDDGYKEAYNQAIEDAITVVQAIKKQYHPEHQKGWWFTEIPQKLRLLKKREPDSPQVCTCPISNYCEFHGYPPLEEGEE